MPKKDRLFEIWFSLRCGAANTEFRALLEHFGSPYDVFNADEAELEQVPCSPRLKQALADKSLQESSRIMEFCRQNHVGILYWQDPEYPASLRPLRDPPILLYYRGNLPNFTRRLCISVVGTRRMSEYGKRMAYRIGYELASAGAVIVSGMALGNDSVAAAGAITAGGQTVAILGCGIDVVYPREHEHLYAEIAAHGVIFTEYPPGTPPDGRHFPVRNRIISGFSQGTVVIEGNRKSGALITAKTAILQGRDIYAFPGNVGETNSEGTNELIVSGAAAILSARDVLENYAFLYRDTVDLSALLHAEKSSDLDEDALLRLGVFTRTEAAPAPPRQARASKPGATKPGAAKPGVAKPGAVKQDAAKPGAPGVPPLASANRATPEDAASPKTPPSPASSVAAHGDASERILRGLTDTQRAVFEAVPLDCPVSVEYLTREGFSVSQIMAAVTILEIKGLLLTLPGGLIGRK